MDRERIFFSYVFDDKVERDHLAKLLDPFARRQQIELWDYQAGDERLQSIRSILPTARVAVLLLSKDYLSDENVVRYELPEIIAEARARVQAKSSRLLHVLPILIGACDYKTEMGDREPLDRRSMRSMQPAEQEALFQRMISQFEAWTRSSSVPSNGEKPEQPSLASLHRPNQDWRRLPLAVGSLIVLIVCTLVFWVGFRRYIPGTLPTQSSPIVTAPSPQKTSVRVTLQSKPAYSTIRDQSGTILGHTPWINKEVPRSEQLLRLSLECPGYKTEPVDLDVRQDVSNKVVELNSDY